MNKLDVEIFQAQINGRDSAMEADTDYMNSGDYMNSTVAGWHWY